MVLKNAKKPNIKIRFLNKKLTEISKNGTSGRTRTATFSRTGDFESFVSKDYSGLPKITSNY